MAETVGSIALVLKTFFDSLRSVDSTLNIVFDESISYETSIQAYRSRNKIFDRVEQYDPLLVFNRSPLQPVEEMGAKARRFVKSAVDLDLGEVKLITAVLAKVDLSMLYLTKDMKKLEQFEIMYLSESGFRSVKKFSVDYGELGSFDYAVKWGDLESVTVQSEGAYYKSVSFPATVRGWYFVLGGVGKIIKVIQGITYDFNNVELSTFTINS